MSRATVLCELHGIPAVAVVTSGFLLIFDAVARGSGLEGLGLAHYPGVVMNDSVETMREKVLDNVFPEVLAGLASPVVQARKRDEPAPREIVFRGSLDQVDDHFYERMWTDGLPVVPPTVARVDEFLRFTDRDPTEVLGILLPECREATIWNIAVNGVMAGCRPEYMPLLVAAVEAVVDHEFRLEDNGSTAGWETLIVVSGPAARDLDFATGTGLLKTGRRANTSIGRFLRLYTRNVAGFRTPPGNTDKSSFGSNFYVALAEDPALSDNIGWPTLHVERGFSPEASTVTVQSVVNTSSQLYSHGTTALEHMEAFSQICATACGGWTMTGVFYQRWHPLLVISPSVAGVIARDGWTKDHIRQHLYEHARVPARWLDRTALDIGAEEPWFLTNQVARGDAPAVYAESNDPDRLVPTLLRPEWLSIVVAGDPGRNQSRIFVNNHEQGAPVTKRVDFVEGWQKLLPAGR